MRFIVKKDEKYNYFYISPDNEDDSIFGSDMPRDKKEAEQCARAANIGYSMAINEIKRRVFRENVLDIGL